LFQYSSFSEFSLNFPIFPKGEIPNPNRFKISSKALDLVLKFLTYDPRKRISTAEALRHPYFDKYSFHKNIFKNTFQARPVDFSRPEISSGSCF